MKFRGKEYNARYIAWFILNILVLIDIVCILLLICFELPSDIAWALYIFDLMVCFILLGEFCINFYLSKPKKVFLKQKSNWIDLIAAIPFDLILPAIFSSARFLRLIRLLKFLRVIVLFSKFFDSLNIFLKKSNLDRIGLGIILTVLFFTLLMYFFGPSYGLFDDFYFVVVTLTTVGYGDITPVTFNEKVIALILIIVGIFIFSMITAAISSYLTDRLISEDEKVDKEAIMDSLNSISEELKEIKRENSKLQEQNEMLGNEILKLNDILKNRK
ncbi:ion transporter [Methanobrevibacter millerae]|uniref:Ion transport protein n=1 Tax=Methanobrevibacter millerae TaxID=230361 RepID=A0A0U3EBM7_9EURY|nr:ion transporter [Methanobrevibacter millerae]ALT69009.1 ion transport protein [Methanobrevibacter millerae]